MKNTITILTFVLCSISFSQVDYDSQIQPIFDANCVWCHSNGAAYTGGLELTSYTDLMVGGYNTDETNVLSVLEDYIVSGYMPTWGEDPLPEEDVELITLWISEGGNPSSGEQDGCILSDGTIAENGWYGEDVGDNWCNWCFCEDGFLNVDIIKL